MPSCIVPNCKNTDRSVKSKRKNISFHRFPSNNLERIKLWLSKCKIGNCKHSIAVHSKNCLICSEHFRDSDYVRDLKSELMGTKPRKILKDDAVPTLNLPELSCNCVLGSKKASKLLPRNLLGTRCIKRDKRFKKRETVKKLCSAPGMLNKKRPGRKKGSKCITYLKTQEAPSTHADTSPAGDITSADNELNQSVFENVSKVPDEQKRLRNDLHCQSLLRNMFLDEATMDVTLRAQNKTVKAHRSVLRQTSGYFFKVLSLDMSAECEVRFNDIDYVDLLKLVAFIYLGEVCVTASNLEEFLRVAEVLEVFSLLPSSSVTIEETTDCNVPVKEEKDVELLPLVDPLTKESIPPTVDFAMTDSSITLIPFTNITNEDYISSDHWNNTISCLAQIKKNQDVSRL